jgi:flagellar biosynthesis chaperone FliJ
MTEKYPLDQLAQIKQRRLEEAEKVLREKRRILEEEQGKLASLEQKRDEVKDHYLAKLNQLREKLDAGTATDKIQQMKHYLKMVTENLKAEEVKVEAQQKVVKAAEHLVDVARQDLFKKQKDVEKLSLHHTEWKKEMDKIEAHQEEVASDEMGNATHSLKKRKHGRRG